MNSSDKNISPSLLQNMPIRPCLNGFFMLTQGQNLFKSLKQGQLIGTVNLPQLDFFFFPFLL